MSAASTPANDATPAKAGGIVARAIVKGAVYYDAGARLRRAAPGEYDIAHQDGLVGFRRSAGDDAFTLSLDAFMRHIHEGRIALVERAIAA